MNNVLHYSVIALIIAASLLLLGMTHMINQHKEHSVKLMEINTSIIELKRELEKPSKQSLHPVTIIPTIVKAVTTEDGVRIQVGDRWCYAKKIDDPFIPDDERDRHCAMVSDIDDGYVMYQELHTNTLESSTIGAFLFYYDKKYKF